MEGGEWRAESGGWRVEGGEWRVESGDGVYMHVVWWMCGRVKCSVYLLGHYHYNHYHHRVRECRVHGRSFEEWFSATVVASMVVYFSTHGSQYGGVLQYPR